MDKGNVYASPSSNDVRCLATCSQCCETHMVDFDVTDLGIDFVCGLINQECNACSGTSDFGPCLTTDYCDEQDLSALMPAERQELLCQFAVQTERLTEHVAPIGEKIAKGHTAAKTRYLDGKVVSTKGERFIEQSPSLLQPYTGGTNIGGIIGSQKLGRRGLGFRKRPKAEVNRVCLSNKQRTRVWKQVWCTSRDRGPAVVHGGFQVPYA